MVCVFFRNNKWAPRDDPTATGVASLFVAQSHPSRGKCISWWVVGIWLLKTCVKQHDYRLL